MRFVRTHFRGIVALGYVVALVVAALFSLCTSRWILCGLAPVLLVERYFFRLLPWPGPVELVPALLARAGFFLFGASTAYVLGKLAASGSLLGPGMVSLPAAARIGFFVSIGLFLVEIAFEQATTLADRFWKPRAEPALRLRNLVLLTGCFVPLFVLAPLFAFHPLSIRPTRTPAHLGLDYEDVLLTTSDGLELVGWLVPHPQPRGSLIFCHGHGGNREQSFIVMRQMHDLGFHVLAFDFRASGESPGQTVTFGLQEVEDLRAAETFLVARFPAAPIFVFGISYGAAVTLQALPRLEHVRAAWVESGFARLSDVAAGRFPWLAPNLRRPLLHGYNLLAWLDAGIWPLAANPVDHLAQTRIPICFCHGTEDDLIPLAQAEELYATYQGPKCCYWIEQAGHGNTGKQAGDAYNRWLRDFFEEQLQKGSGVRGQ